MNYESEFDASRFLPESRPVPALPEQDGHTIFPRQPHLGYSAALLGLWALLLVVVAVPVVAAGSALHLLPRLAELQSHIFPKTSILIEALSYGLALAIAAPVFSRAWQRPFFQAISWSADVARAYAGRLVLTGIGVSVAAQLLESRMTLPKKMPMDAFFRTPFDVLIVAAFGTLIAPLAEEIFFRGFLLPGVAIAWDWLTLPKTEEARLRWQTTDTLSRNGLVVSGVLTSLLFAVLHAAQLGFAWNAVGVLWLVGGVLTVVRIRLRSLAASTLVHMTYNGFIFAVVLIATGGLRHMEQLTQH